MYKKMLRYRLPLAITLFVALVVIGGLVYSHRHTKQVNGPMTESPTASDNTTNLNGPTAQDKQDVDQHKTELPAQGDTPAATGTKAVTPVIVDAGQYDQQIEVRSFIPGIYEDNGTCTAILTAGSSKLTKQVNAVKDATTTRCTNLAIPRSEFSTGGTWVVTISYNSASAQGTSQAKSFEVK